MMEKPPEQKSPEHLEVDPQTAQENACREQFIHDIVAVSELSPEERMTVTAFIRSHPGPWREYNGTDFKVEVHAKSGSFWKVTFGVYFDDYQAQEIDVEIPLS